MASPEFIGQRFVEIFAHPALPFVQTGDSLFGLRGDWRQASQCFAILFNHDFVAARYQLQQVCNGRRQLFDVHTSGLHTNILGQFFATGQSASGPCRGITAFNPRRGCQHKAQCVSAGLGAPMESHKPVKRAAECRNDDHLDDGCRPFHGLRIITWAHSHRSRTGLYAGACFAG